MGGTLFVTARLDFMLEDVQTEVNTTVKWSVFGFSGSKSWHEVSENAR